MVFLPPPRVLKISWARVVASDLDAFRCMSCGIHVVVSCKKIILAFNFKSFI